MRHALILAALVLVAAPAAAQTGNPPPKAIYPLPPPPPVVMTTPGGHDAPVRIETTDRATRCLQYGKSIGVPADQMDDYMKRCVLQ
jgi:hypothetical protein